MKEGLLDALLNPDTTQDWRGIVIVATLALPVVLFWLMRSSGSKKRQRMSASIAEETPDLPPTPADGGVALWLRANMAPRSNPPNPQRDIEYFALLYGAAAAGHPEAQMQVGRLAFAYPSFVECSFWVSLARAHGMSGTEEILADCREAWLSVGCPGAEDSVTQNFDIDQAAVGHAMLNIESGRDVERGVFVLTEQEMRGNLAAIEIFRALRHAVSCAPRTASEEEGKGTSSTTKKE